MYVLINQGRVFDLHVIPFPYNYSQIAKLLAEAICECMCNYQVILFHFIYLCIYLFT